MANATLLTNIEFAEWLIYAHQFLNYLDRLDSHQKKVLIA